MDALASQDELNGNILQKEVGSFESQSQLFQTLEVDRAKGREIEEETRELRGKWEELKERRSKNEQALHEEHSRKQQALLEEHSKNEKSLKEEYPGKLKALRDKHSSEEQALREEYLRQGQAVPVEYFTGKRLLCEKRVERGRALQNEQSSMKTALLDRYRQKQGALDQEYSKKEQTLRMQCSWEARALRKEGEAIGWNEYDNVTMEDFHFTEIGHGMRRRKDIIESIETLCNLLDNSRRGKYAKPLNNTEEEDECQFIVISTTNRDEMLDLLQDQPDTKILLPLAANMTDSVDGSVAQMASDVEGGSVDGEE